MWVDDLSVRGPNFWERKCHHILMPVWLQGDTKQCCNITNITAYSTHHSGWWVVIMLMMNGQRSIKHLWHHRIVWHLFGDKQLNIDVSLDFCRCLSCVWYIIAVFTTLPPATFLSSVCTVSSSTQASPDKSGGVSSYSPCLFGKGIVVHARQTNIQQTKTFTKTKLIWDNNTNCQQLYVVV